MSKDLVMAKFLLYGDPENKHEPNPEQINGLYKAIFDEDILPGLIRHMAKLEFEASLRSCIVFLTRCRPRRTWSPFSITCFGVRSATTLQPLTTSPRTDQFLST
jgi:hypothetical protein